MPFNIQSKTRTLQWMWYKTEGKQTGKVTAEILVFKVYLFSAMIPH